MKVNEEFLFSCATGTFDRWQGSDVASAYGARENIVRMHAYSIMEAREIKGHRLLKVRNPWGEGEWKGAWSDGSEQWFVLPQHIIPLLKPIASPETLSRNSPAPL